MLKMYVIMHVRTQILAIIIIRAVLVLSKKKEAPNRVTYV